MGKRQELRYKRQELRKLRDEIGAARDEVQQAEQTSKWKRTQQEIFQLKRELLAAQEGWAGDEPVTGALPDFVIIGAAKSGTTFFHHLLTQHPLVEPAAFKEMQFFDVFFSEGVEWYRRGFPQPRLKDRRRTITGEATPHYLFHPHAAQRMAQTIPQARLIALLRNPVDRAYSHYQMAVNNGRETLSFEEAIRVEGPRLRREMDKMLRDERYFSRNYRRFSYLSTGVYADQLLRWSKFFPKEQMLVLKSECFFERPADSLKVALDFLDLSDWEPEASELRKSRNAREYEEMDPSTRRRLEEYFEPHNRRLYDYLGRDFGW